MAIAWGTAVKNSSFSKGNIQLGYEITRTEVGYSTSSVTWTLKIYLGAQYQIGDSNNKLNVTGSFPNRTNFSQQITIASSGGSGAYATQEVYSESATTYGGSGTTHSVSFDASLGYLFEYDNATKASVSGSASVTIPTPVAPGAPGVSVTPGNGSLSVSYSAPGSSGTSSIVRYEYYTSADGTVRTTPSNPFSITGLSNGTSYTVYVRAVNSELAGGYGSASTTPRTTPSAPGSFTATANTFGKVSLSWTTPSNGGSALTSYVLTRTVAGGTPVTLTAPSTSATTYDDTGVEPAKAYTYTLYATNAAGNGTSASVDITSLGGVGNIATNTTGGYVKIVPRICTNATPGAQVWTVAQARVWHNEEWKYCI